MERQAQLEEEIGQSRESDGCVIVKNAIFSLEAPPPAPPKNRWAGNVAVFFLVSASTAAMMVCPCDVVGIHDHFAISMVALASLFGIAAACLVYRRMSRDSGLTGFLRAVIALAIVGVCVLVELFAAMEIVAWMARWR